MTPTLANLVAELEHRLTGTSVVDRLPDEIAVRIPEAETYVLALFDGLGVEQLAHPAALDLRRSLQATIDAPYPTTTTVSMATVATGLHPVTHGTIGHQMWIPDIEQVVNVLKWRAPDGRPVGMDTLEWLPGPNLWERLAANGVESVTVQPGEFQATPLSRALYRGARFEPVYTHGERIDAVADLCAVGRRLVFVYFAEVDVAAHIGGQSSEMYRSALAAANRAWVELATRLPAGVTMVGTADHGHLDFPEDRKRLIRDPEFGELVFFGDPRSLMVRGERRLIERLAADTGSSVVERDEIVARLGSGPQHPDLVERLPDAVVEPPRDVVLIPRGMDKRLVGYHGGLDRAERAIPVLVAP